jgi:curved DNA-binding protein CbpA
VLGLKRTATRQQLSERLRELTRTEHPDHGGSTERFSRLTRAYHEALEATP